ncbi:unnamed protein product, partial [Rotaria sordida]
MTITDIKNILHAMPCVKYLELDIPCEIGLIDGYQWESIVVNLIRFDFRFRVVRWSASDIAKINYLNSFRTPFWLEQKRWKWCCWQRQRVTRQWLIRNSRRLSHDRHFTSAITDHKHNSATDVDPFQRQLSILDPLSDRVSTILVWKNLTVLTREDKVTEFCQRMKCWKKFTLKRQRLLNNISGAITGGLWAVMGQISLNGAPYDNAELKRIAGYVMQDDLLNGNLTVYETLMYTAELRLPRHSTRQKRVARVQEVMFSMGISHVKDVIVGTVLKKGISGGERKRLCVGMQLLNRPQLLFLDEPTSGLDSVTALDLIRTFHSLAHGQLPEKVVTIVCSIHQPQSKIFYLFDSLILLKQGNIIYQGPRQQAMDVYRMAGFPCPLYTNPADHLLDVITPMKTIDDQSGSSERQANADKLILAIQAPIEIDLNMGTHKRIAQMADLPKNPLWITQFFILLRRNFQEQFRSSKIILTSLIQTIIIAVLIGCVFLQIGNGQSSTVRRSPVIFFCAINQGVFGALMVINS